MKREIHDELFELRRRCEAGDPDAWETFYLRYYLLVTAIVRNVFLRRGLGAAAEDVEDGVADFFAEICAFRRSALSSFRGDGSFRAFLSVLAANHARRRGAALLRIRERSGAPLESLVEEEHYAVDPVTEEAGDDLEYLLGRLSDGEAGLLRLLYVEEVEPVLAAEVLGISRTALYIRKHRLLKRARALLDERSAAMAGSSGGGERES